MNRKYTLILVAVALIGFAGFLYLRGGLVPNPQLRPNNNNAPQVDNLSKSDQPAVEENINGYDLHEDLEITKDTREAGEKESSSLSQQQQTQLLEKLSAKPMNSVLQEYKTTLPKTINNKLQYANYKMSYDYFLITAANGAELMKDPLMGAAVVCRVNSLDKISLLQQVQGETVAGSNIWYRVACSHDNKTEEGYLHSSAGVPRSFRFTKMQEAVNALKQQLTKGELNFIRNYKNQNGAPPAKTEGSVDQYGYRSYHSAPAYVKADLGSDFRYIPDGMLVRILGEVNDFYQVNVPTFGGDYFIPKRYIDRTVKLSRLNQVVVVDRNQQNEAVFAVRDNSLDLISYTLATTGVSKEASFETTLGSFKAIEKKDRFEYLQKGTSEVAGYAPFAIRFTGGAYIHGVPVDYKVQDGKKVDPGIVEYLQTIGTVPRSHMCVRNFTSHAKFLYNWLDLNNGAVIVIE